MVNLLDPYLKDPLDFHLIQGQGNDRVGRHHRVVRVAIEVLDQADQQRDSRPGHQYHPGPSSYCKESDEQDDADHGEHKISGAGEYHGANGCGAHPINQGCVDSAFQHPHANQGFKDLEQPEQEQDDDSKGHNRYRDRPLLRPNLLALFHPAETPDRPEAAGKIATRRV
jgi:hypothetical protein